MRRLLMLVGLCLLCGVPVLASVSLTVYDDRYKVNLGYTLTDAWIDWAQQAILVITRAEAPLGALPKQAHDAARTLALAEARRQIATTMGRIRLTGYATLAEVVNAHLLPANPVPAITPSIKPVAESWDTEKKYIILACALPLTGPASPAEIAARMLTIEQHYWMLEGGRRLHPPTKMEMHQTDQAHQQTSGPYTGVIFDCSGFKYKPVLLPKLVTPDGEEVWGTADINPTLVVAKGVTGYASSIDAAIASGRVGATPLLIRPVGLSGPLHGDLVIRPDDIKLLIDQNAATKFLSTLAVEIVTN